MIVFAIELFFLPFLLNCNSVDPEVASLGLKRLRAISAYCCCSLRLFTSDGSSVKLSARVRCENLKNYLKKILNPILFVPPVC